MAEAARASPRPAVVPAILVVDDNASIAKLVAEHLRDLGYRVETAFDPQTALARLAGASFGLVLTDVQMPGLEDGFQLYAQACARWPELNGRFVFMTAGTLTPRRRAWLEETATPCLRKPFDLDVATDLVRRRLDAAASPARH